jgi:electron transport complex protein RnfD
MTFGGLGQNIFNPAITARVFLLISFPAIMTDWTVPQGFIQNVDAVSGATLLGIAGEKGALAVADVDMLNTFLLNIGGSAGEISALALLAGWVYLLVRKVIKPWITLSIFGTVAVIAAIFHLCNPEMFTGPVFNLLTGGIILGACFMATDYVTSPMSNWGGVVFGVGIGFLLMMIRYFGSYPEGVSFAILLMNMTVPLLNRWFHGKKYGRA